MFGALKTTFATKNTIFETKIANVSHRLSVPRAKYDFSTRKDDFRDKKYIFADINLIPSKYMGTTGWCS